MYKRRKNTRYFRNRRKYNTKANSIRNDWHSGFGLIGYIGEGVRQRKWAKTHRK